MQLKTPKDPKADMKQMLWGVKGRDDHVHLGIKKGFWILKK